MPDSLKQNKHRKSRGEVVHIVVPGAAARRMRQFVVDGKANSVSDLGKIAILSYLEARP